MINITTKIDAKGFWYLLETEDKVSFSFQYFALGSQGNFCSGEVEGIITPSSGWQFCQVNFPILHIGITSMDILTVENKETVQPAIAPVKSAPPADISRRKMINQTVLGLLFGGAIIPTLLGQTASAQGKEGDQTRFSPYGQENYSPY